MLTLVMVDMELEYNTIYQVTSAVMNYLFGNKLRKWGTIVYMVICFVYRGLLFTYCALLYVKQ